MSSWTTSATRRSRSDLLARSTATLAAFSQESLLVPISSMTLYTLSAIDVLLLASGSMIAAPPPEEPNTPVPLPEDDETARRSHEKARPARPGALLLQGVPFS